PEQPVNYDVHGFSLLPHVLAGRLPRKDASALMCVADISRVFSFGRQPQLDHALLLILFVPIVSIVVPFG
ncbi:unnamed protein product, partial [Symbiodinium microadriaticum]